MDIEQFMQGYKAAWEGRDDALFCALFARDATYRNTPFAEQRGHDQLAAYWQRVKLQEDVRPELRSPRVRTGQWHCALARHVPGGFRGTVPHLGRVDWDEPCRAQAGRPSPGMVLDGVLHAQFADGLCQECRLWWHSMAQT